MATMTVTNFELGGSIELHRGEFRDEVVNFAGAATYKKGTIFARITASGKLTPWVIGGAGGAEVPVAVLTYDIARTLAGDDTHRVLVSGVVNKNRLIVHADGTGANITNAHLDMLRSKSIVPIDVAQLGDYDTQD